MQGSSRIWLVLLSAAVSGLRAPAPRIRMNSNPGYETDRFAGRYALGKNLPTVSSKNGMQFAWRGKAQPVRVLGGHAARHGLAGLGRQELPDGALVRVAVGARAVSWAEVGHDFYVLSVTG